MKKKKKIIVILVIILIAIKSSKEKTQLRNLTQNTTAKPDYFRQGLDWLREEPKPRAIFDTIKHLPIEWHIQWNFWLASFCIFLYAHISAGLTLLPVSLEDVEVRQVLKESCGAEIITSVPWFLASFYGSLHLKLTLIYTYVTFRVSPLKHWT